MTTAKITSLALVVALIGATACGDDEEATPVKPDGGKTPVFTSDAEVEDEKDSDVEQTDEDGGVTEDDDGGNVEVDPDSGAVVNCDGPNGCYACTPKTSLQFLNACVDDARGIVGLHFDNAARIKNFDPANPLGT